MRKRLPFLFIKATVVALLVSPSFLVAHASLIDELRDKISERASEIAKLQEEIDGYQEQVNRVGKEAETLKRAVEELTITDKKLATDIRLTERKTSSAELEISKLGLEISDREQQIKQNSGALGEAIRQANELESRSLIEVIFSYPSFSVFWGNIESLERFEARVRENLLGLQDLKKGLESKKNQSEKEKKNLLALASQLTDQKNIVKINKEAKNRLLSDTKSKESNYKALLDERLAQKNALEDEIRDFEARIRIEIDPTSLPETGTGIFRWPLDKVVLTQYFGNTPFASQNPQVYNGKGHNGIDLRAAIGTPVKAAAQGIVSGVGDTDRECYGVSYGKWALVRHENGLSTLYAHLSLVRVGSGQSVEMGDVVGYSGNTGYSTGPHLHFTVFATAAVSISENYKSRICGTLLTLPLSAQNGYLNPLSYLPAVP